MKNTTATALVLAGALAAATLTGCGSDDPTTGDATSDGTTTAAPTDEAPTDGATPDDRLPDGVAPGLPDGVEPPSDASAGSGWADDGAGLWVVAFGSSTNPTVATLVSADATTVTLSLAPVDPDGPGTMDYVPTTTVVELPEDVDTTGTVSVVLGDLGTVEVAEDAPGWLTGGE